MSDTEQNPTLIYCDICDVSISGENNFNSHVLGKKHVKKSIAQKVAKSGNRLTTTPASDHPWAEMMCNLYSEFEEGSSSKTYEECGNSSKSYQSTDRKRKESKPAAEDEKIEGNPWKAMMSKMQDPDGKLTREFDQEEGELNDEDEYKMEQAERENHAKELEEYEKACNACGPKLRCTCCGEVYSDPVRLSCGHLIDRGCAEAKRQFGLIVMCPMCKKRIYCKDVDALQTDNDIACQLPPPVRDIGEDDGGADDDSDEYEYDDDRRRKRRKKGKDKKKKRRQGRDYYDDGYSNDDYNYNYNHNGRNDYDFNPQPTGFASVRRQNQAYHSDYGQNRSNDHRSHPFTRQQQQQQPDMKPTPLMQGFREQDAMEALFGSSNPLFPPDEHNDMNQPFMRGPNPFVRSNPNYPPNERHPYPPNERNSYPPNERNSYPPNPYEQTQGRDMQDNMMDGGFQRPPQNMDMTNAGSGDRESSLRDLLAQQQSIMRMIQETREAKVKLVPSSNDPSNNEMLKQQMELQRLREEVEDQKRQLALQQKTLQEQLQLQQARFASQAAPTASPSNSRSTLLPLPSDKSQLSAPSNLQTDKVVPEPKSTTSTTADKPSHTNAIEQVTQLYQQAFQLYQKAVKAASVDGAESEASKQALKRYSEVYENLVALQNAASGAAKSASTVKTGRESEPNIPSTVPLKSSNIPEKDSFPQLGKQSDTTKDSFRDSQQQKPTELINEPADSKSIIPFIQGYTEKPAVAGLSESSDDQSNAKRARMDSEGTPSTPSLPQVDLEQSPYLLLSGLKVGIKATNVKEICAGFGRVVSIKIVGTRSGGTPQIYAYVTMDNAASATEAVKQISGKFFFGSQIDAKKIKSTPFVKK